MQEQTQTLTVYRDGELDPELDPELNPPAPNILDHVAGAISRFTGNIALQARMATFDTLHGTNYRHIRNALVEQQRREKFEKSIGLIAIDRKK